MINKNGSEKEDFRVIKDGDSYTISHNNDIFNIKKDEWDSQILGINLYKINKIELNSFDANLIKKFLDFIKLKFNDIDCMTYKIESTNLELINVLQKNGFTLVGVPIKLSVDLSGTQGDNLEPSVRLSKNDDISILALIARDSFLHAYRYNDKNLDKNKVDDLYSEWIKNCCNGRANAVLVHETENIPTGFIACKINGRVGLIDLIAVDKKMRGKGIGQKLVLNSLSWFKDKVNRVEVFTEAMNYPSIKMYQSNGFKIDWVGANLNYWFKK
ncbi:MAG: Spore coat polysaccharide biosynthesis protein SpsD [archaeon GW2011_AR20]|nr:MAG: Spore coat polysaccharide biosynthesis protein SpsD [archaeon GW2011_AR20]AQS28177.1 hypothetical protein [uncultured archaeon]MBS3160527.1 GNAT family N-acetyltransferase [Candidatus Woesearchaeota archaeon]